MDSEKAELLKAISNFNTQREFADALGVGEMVVYQWKVRGLPAKWVIPIVELCRDKENPVQPHKLSKLIPKPENTAA